MGVQKLSLTGSTKHAADDQLRGLSVLFLDGDEVFIDNGAIHGKSRLETGVKFVQNRAEVPNGRTVLGLWITLHRFPEGQGFYGVQPFELFLDKEAQVGYKNLVEQVKGMEKAVRGEVNLAGVPQAARQKIVEYLQKVRPDLWQHAQPAFLEAMTSLGD
ncbi:YwhD family protein [Alicyclobacillus tolerans]|uniref:YwhD family protein n=1 Tax=Alicyclobacillus tolerans TaxID=90970 RepID=UPI003B767439